MYSDIKNRHAISSKVGNTFYVNSHKMVSFIIFKGLFQQSIPFHSNRVTDKVATRLLGKCRPYLVHLNLRGCQLLTSTIFYSIRECKNLQDLNLSECPAVNVSSIKIFIFLLSKSFNQSNNIPTT